jgi:hypothetical protein
VEDEVDALVVDHGRGHVQLGATGEDAGCCHQILDSFADPCCLGDVRGGPNISKDRRAVPWR